MLNIVLFDRDELHAGVMRAWGNLVVCDITMSSSCQDILLHRFHPYILRKSRRHSYLYIYTVSSMMRA